MRKMGKPGSCLTRSHGRHPSSCCVLAVQSLQAGVEKCQQGTARGEVEGWPRTLAWQPDVAQAWRRCISNHCHQSSSGWRMVGIPSVEPVGKSAKIVQLQSCRDSGGLQLWPPVIWLPVRCPTALAIPVAYSFLPFVDTK